MDLTYTLDRDLNSDTIRWALARQVTLYGQPNAGDVFDILHAAYPEAPTGQLTEDLADVLREMELHGMAS